MKILIDDSPLTQSVCGVYRYAACIIPLLIKKLPESSIKLCPIESIIEFHNHQHHFDPFLASSFSKYDKFVSKTYCSIINEINLINKHIKENPNKDKIVAKKIKRELLRLSKSLAKLAFSESKIIKEAIKDIEIYHNLYNCFPDEVKKSNSIKKFITVHDVIPAVRPDLIVNSRKHAFQKQIQQFSELGNKEIIFTVSQFSKDDLCNFNKNVDPSNVYVTHLAAGDIFKKAEEGDIQQIRAQFKIPNDARYILSTLTSDPKKNMPFVVAGFEELLKSENFHDLYLVLFGGLKTADLTIINKLPSNIRNKIILTGYVNDEEMAILHSGALCFCFPSLYEGFGIPVLEAMQCCTPVITSNVSSLPEVAGDAAILIDPLDKDALIQAFLSLYKGPELRQTLIQKGQEQAKKFSWDACTDIMIDVYKAHSRPY